MIAREYSKNPNIKGFHVVFIKTMPNLKGGKKYKAGKHSDTKAEFHEIGEGQQIARVIKHLGDRNILVYCNDGYERIAHIRGGLSKKKACIDTGDLVLISIRGLELDNEGTKEDENEDGNEGTKESSKKSSKQTSKKHDRGDVLAKYDHELLGQLKKMEGINKNLFLQLETIDRTKIKTTTVDIEEAFEFETAEQMEDEESEQELNKDELGKKHKLQEIKRAAERDKKHTTHIEEDLDIDAI